MYFVNRLAGIAAFSFVLSNAYAAEAWLSVTNVSDEKVNGLAVNLIQSPDLATEGRFGVRLMDLLKPQVKTLPGYSDRFSANCYVPFLDRVAQVDCLFNFSDQGNHSLILGPNASYVPYAGYVNENKVHELFMRAFVDWKSKPLYLITSTLLKRMEPGSVLTGPYRDVFKSGNKTLVAQIDNADGQTTGAKTVVVKEDGKTPVLSAVITKENVTLSFPLLNLSQMTVLNFTESLADVPADFGARLLAVYIANGISSNGTSRIMKALDNPGCDGFPDVRCTLGCCKTHDQCYQENECTWSSWFFLSGGWISGLKCQGCNIMAAGCILGGCLLAMPMYTAICKLKGDCLGVPYNDPLMGDLCYDASCKKSFNCGDFNCDCSPCKRETRMPQSSPISTVLTTTTASTPKPTTASSSARIVPAPATITSMAQQTDPSSTSMTSHAPTTTTSISSTTLITTTTEVPSTTSAPTTCTTEAQTGVNPVGLYPTGLGAQNVPALTWQLNRKDAPDMSMIAGATYCAGLGVGWRLPTVWELYALYQQRGVLGSDLNGNAFGTSTAVVDRPSMAWFVVFANGNVDYINIDNPNGSIRCVKSS